jgi:hypothetical protein
MVRHPLCSRSSYGLPAAHGLHLLLVFIHDLLHLPTVSGSVEQQENGLVRMH